MMDCAKPETMCDDKSDNAGQECGNPFFAYFYFISFYIICSFLVTFSRLFFFLLLRDAGLFH